MPEYWRADEGETLIRNKIDKLSAASRPSAEEQEELKNARAQLQREYPDTAQCANGPGGHPIRKHEEVWFMGCHSDVGGGNDINDLASLSNIPFR